MKNKINLWVIAFIIIIGAVIGYVSMGVITRIQKVGPVADSTNVTPKDSLENDTVHTIAIETDTTVVKEDDRQMSVTTPKKEIKKEEPIITPVKLDTGETKGVTIEDLQALKKECSPYVTSGRNYSKIPEVCKVAVNGKKTTDYQSFKMGVNYGAYTNVVVTSILTDSKGQIIQINVSAKESEYKD